MSYWICDKDQNCIDCPKYYPEETCEHYIEVEPVKHIHTEADRIRAMTDEELAAAAWRCCPDKAHAKAPCIPNRNRCFLCWLNWLKQEADE